MPGPSQSFSQWLSREPRRTTFMIWLIAAGMAAAVVGAVMGIAWITEPGRPAAGERHPGSYGTLVRPDAPKSA